MAEQALKMEPDQTTKPSLDPRFIKNLKGKDFVLYSGLLDLGHQIGIQSIVIDPIQFPKEENGNEGICRAIVTGTDGRQFIEIGDASPANTTAQIASHVLRMAATRAKARALRDMSNIGMTCLEELGDIDNIIGSNDSKVIPMKTKTQRTSNDSPKPKNNTQEKAPGNHPEKTKGAAEANPEKKTSDAKISNAQRNAILSISKRKGYSEESIIQQIQEIFGVPIDNLSASQASNFIKELQAA